MNSFFNGRPDRVSGLLVVMAALCIAGCSNGGSARSEPPPDDPPMVVNPMPGGMPGDPDPMPPGSMPSVEPVLPTDSEDELRRYAEHPEFRNQPALGQVKAHYAYARGATGAGVTVGIVDSGVDAGHPEFEGRLHADSYHTCDRDGDCPPSGKVELQTHGTHVGGVIAANRDAMPDGPATLVPTDDPDPAPDCTGDSCADPGSGFIGDPHPMHGVAFDAQLFSVGFGLGEPPDSYIPVDLDDPQVQADDQTFTAAAGEMNPRVTAVNLSLGYAGSIELYGEEEIRRAFPMTIAGIAQADVPAAERAIYVWAAGNAYGESGPDGMPADADSVELLAGLPARIPELRGHSLAVVAVNTDGEGEIAGFSNRCGIARDFCLAAPGVYVWGPLSGDRDGYIAADGTSLSAPIVTGGLALLAQHYRNQLGNDELVTRLLATANKEGIYADADIYGQGLLDLDAATRPLGETRIVTSGALPGPAALESLSALSSGPAFGDALQRGLAGLELAAFDELDAPFFRPLDGYLRSTAPGARLEDRLWALGKDPRGAAWHGEGFELRARFDRGAAGWQGDLFPRFYQTLNNARVTRPAAARLRQDRIGSFSLSGRAGGKDLFVGFRTHPGWRFGLHGAGLIAPDTFTDDAAFANPFLALSRNGTVAGFSTPMGRGALRLAAFHGAAQYGERRDPDTGRSAGALLEYRFAPGAYSGVALQAGWLREAERLAGSRPSGAFGELDASAGFLGFAAHRRLGARWTALISAHGGLSRAGAQSQGLLHDLSPLWTSAFGVGLVGEGIGHARGRLALRVSQPLRVEAGAARLRWPTGRSRDRRALLEETRLALTPSGRQLDLELGWSRPWQGGHAYLAALGSRDAGHVRGAGDFALLLRYRRGF